MKQISSRVFAVILFTALSVRAVTTNTSPDFKEVYDLLRANLPGATDAELNRAAVDGLLNELQEKVALLPPHAYSAIVVEPAALVAPPKIFENDIGYVRIGRVEGGLTKSVGALRTLDATNKLKGVVLDLRFASGDDYAEAADTAGLFLAKACRLLDAGKGMIESKSKTNSIALPVVALVNRETSGAAEALAASLRWAGAGLILGEPTAGRAAVMREFPLKSGGRLQLACVPIKLGDGSTLSGDGVKPDIEVKVKPADERIYFADPYANLGKTNLLASASVTVTNQPDGTNRLARRRVNEADLVRARREGRDTESDTVADGRETGPERAVLRDPVLARALDLLQGLALVRKAHAD